MENTVTITIERFEELIGKEMAYDIFTKIVEVDRYASDVEKALFLKKGGE
jgi:hypothetical protein